MTVLYICATKASENSGWIFFYFVSLWLDISWCLFAVYVFRGLLMITLQPKPEASNQHGIQCEVCNRTQATPEMFEELNTEEKYDEEAEVAALFSSPIDLWEDCELEAVIKYMKDSGKLQLPSCWPTDY